MMTTAVRKLEEKFLLPLLQQARADPRTASNAVNKVRDLEVSAATKNIQEEEIRRVLSIIRSNWKKYEFCFQYMY